MKWPWSRRPETRTAGYTDAIISAFLAAASGSSTPSPLGTAAVETAAGLYGRAFAAAKVTPEHPALDPLTLAQMARDLIRDGSSLYVIEVDQAGRVELLPTQYASLVVRGGPSPSTWVYQATTTGPSYSQTVNRPVDAVVHVRLAYDTIRPWIGISPLQHAVESGRLAAALERSLADELSGPVGMVIPVPEGQQEPVDNDDEPPIRRLNTDLRSLRGNLALVETMARGHGDAAGAPHGDWTVKRFGPAPPEALVNLREPVERSILSALGVPPSLVNATSATASREAWRQFVHASVEPLARIVEAELRAKLEVDVALDFEALRASDLAGRGRALKQLVDTGVPLAEARQVVGL